MAMDEQLRAVVGRRVRRLRIQAGRGLREQARRIDLAPSALSQLENDRGGLSLERLQLLAADFGLHITDLLAQDNGGPDAQVSEAGFVEVMRNCLTETPSVRRGEGAGYQLLGPGRRHRLQPYILSFAPGGGYDKDPIGHDGEEFAYVLVGAVELVFDETEAYEVAQGDVVRFDAARAHAFRNASETVPAVVIGAATPPW